MELEIKTINSKNINSNNFTIENSDNLTLFKIEGKNSNKSVLISCYLHGNEPCGYNAINELLNSSQVFKNPNSNIYLLLGNTIAAKQNLRYITENFNRIWTNNPKTQIEQKANKITKYLKTKNLIGVLDLHSYSDKTTQPHFFHHNTQFAKKFFDEQIGFGFKVGAEENMLIDNFKNIPSFLIECGYHFDKTSTNLAKNSIKTFLSKLNIIEKIKLETALDINNTLYLEKEANVKFKPSFKFQNNINQINLKHITQDTLLGECKNKSEITVIGENTFENLFYIKESKLYLKKNHFTTLLTSNNKNMFESGCYIYTI
jgi:hypothetical protein